ncbi:Potassium transporter [Zostera marina]|uniref:Potassium transporter n=1 Tax=Zostera marina TaxID=29655 RepID=A0A0K9Q2R2_ZOSMR|nr:Potassium transporter [Zostera marina]
MIPPTKQSKLSSSDAPEQGTDSSHKPNKEGSYSYLSVLSLAYQSLGVVYGDLCTSPLYVYKTTFSGKLRLHEDDEEIFGVLSFIFWTMTLIPLFKYVVIVLSANDNGEGGTFALYSLLCRHAKLCILPNQQASDESLSTYCIHGGAETRHGSVLKEFFRKRLVFRNGLLIFVLLGTCMTMADGVLTPAISVLSAVSGLTVKVTSLHENYVVAISCLILIVVFSLQHLGTHRVAFMFAPIITLWLLSISGIGIYNIYHWNPKIFCALSPAYMVKFLKSTGTEGWVSLGGVVLCITGSEAMFANLGHFSPMSIKVAFTFLVYPCMIIAYMGEAAFLSKHHEDIQQSFYKAIPELVFWPVFIVATLASVVGSQAVISATFSLVSQCCALNCFPHVKIIHTSKTIYGQIYIPEVNWILMCLCLSVTIGLRNTNMIGHAYGIAVTTVMFVTTCLMSLVIIIVWKQRMSLSVVFFVIFGFVEGLYISASFIKVPEGGWIPLVLAVLFVTITYTWNYGTLKKHEFDMENKVSMKRILSSGPSLGMVRVPGIGVVYADVVNGLPGIFGHFATNLPAFHQVLVFLCVKSVQVPYVTEEERFSVGRIGPKEYHMFRCVVRYGYKDVQKENYDFENRLVASILEFVEVYEEKHEEVEEGCSEEEEEEEEEMRVSSSDYTNQPTMVDPENGGIESSFWSEESLEILKSKDCGVAYILGHSHAKAKESSSILKKFAIDVLYAFLSKNCRGSNVNININVPHSSLLEVGMTYNV